MKKLMGFVSLVLTATPLAKKVWDWYNGPERVAHRQAKRSEYRVGD